MSFEPYNLHEKLIDHGNQWADKNGAADLLEETAKTLLSTLAAKFIKEGDPVSKAEHKARSSPEYIEHINSMVEARKKSNRAKVQYDADKALIDMLRSAESTKRAEMNLR